MAIILLLVFKPFKMELSPDQQAEATENILAVVYFENLTNPDDPRRLGEILTELLITPAPQLERVALAIARDAHPGLDVRSYLQHLDQLAAPLYRGLLELPSLAARATWLLHYVTDELGFACCRREPADPARRRRIPDTYTGTDLSHGNERPAGDRNRPAEKATILEMVRCNTDCTCHTDVYIQPKEPGSGQKIQGCGKIRHRARRGH